MKSSKLRINNKRRRTYVRLLGEIQHALLEALDQENHSRGLTRAEIARALDVDKSFVSRKLNGESNMTLETLADLAFALDRPIKVSLPARAVAAGSNLVAPQAVTSADSKVVKPAPVTSTSISAMAA